MSAAADLTQWNEQFGGFELFPERERSAVSSHFEFEMGVAYPCRVTSAKCVRSKMGDLQIELKFDVQADDSEADDVPTVGKSRVWLDLPKQPSDMKRDKETVIKMTQRRYQNLLRVLSAAAPARYSLYAETRKKGDIKEYIDFDGEPMTGSDFNERKIEIQSACVDFADRLEEGQDIEIMQSTLLYIEKRTNPRNEKYPFVNYYARKPTDVKVFKAVDGDSAPF